MKLSVVLFTSLAYTIIAALLVQETAPEVEINFPVLEVPTFDPVDLSGGCSGFSDCTEYLANVVKNIGEGVIYGVLLFFALVGFAIDLIAVIISLSAGIEGAPWYVNLLITAPFTASIGLILYKLIRSGSSED